MEAAKTAIKGSPMPKIKEYDLNVTAGAQINCPNSTNGTNATSIIQTPGTSIPVKKAPE